MNRSDLSKDEQAKLDQALQQIQTAKNYVIEVAGDTDRSGNKAANVELAPRRAEAVVRYLGVQHDVPLRKIYTVGVGSDFPDADNKTRAARKENRRVDIKGVCAESERRRATNPRQAATRLTRCPARPPQLRLSSKPLNNHRKESIRGAKAPVLLHRRRPDDPRAAFFRYRPLRFKA